MTNEKNNPLGSSGSSPKGAPFVGEQVYVDRGGPLPEHYGDTKIILLPRDPQWIFAYWEINNVTKEDVKKKYGENIFSRSRPSIRIYDVTDVDFNGSNAHHTFDVFLTPEAKNWYIYVGKPRRNFCADLGLLVDDGVFITLARSNVVSTPAARISDITDEEWMLVKEDFEKLMKLSGLDKIGATSAEALKAILQRLEVSVSSKGVSSLGGSMVGVLRQEKVRGFWLVADAELIVYGATEPDALVMVQGQPVKLRPDGTFTLRFAFPDGKQEMPIKAMSGDLKETKQITITVKRETK